MVVVIFNALYILCIRYCDRSHLSKQRRFLHNTEAQEMKRKIIPMLMICNSVLETYIGTFFPYISGRNYAPNVGHSQPSSQLCANSTKRRSGTTLKIQRNFTISFTTQSQKDLIFIKHLSYGSRMNMTAVTASNVMLQLFCNFATQICLQHPTASQCLKILEKVSFYKVGN